MPAVLKERKYGSPSAAATVKTAEHLVAVLARYADALVCYLYAHKTDAFVNSDTDFAAAGKTPVAALDTCFAILEDPQLLEAERMEFYGDHTLCLFFFQISFFLYLQQILCRPLQLVIQKARFRFQSFQRWRKNRPAAELSG